MEGIQSNDSKMELLKKSEKHRQELEDEVNLISERTEKIITNALIIGGTLAATYILVRQFSSSKKRKKKKPQRLKVVKRKVSTDDPETDFEEPSAPGIVSQIGTALASQAAIFLLGIAKEKLSEFLQAQFEQTVESNERS